jgi:hypothetical protein
MPGQIIEVARISQQVWCGGLRIPQRGEPSNYCSSVAPKLPELFAHPNVVPLAVNWLAGGWRGPILSVTPP